MLYEFKTKFVKNINKKQKDYVSQKKREFIILKTKEESILIKLLNL